jgi:hypothetical protein
MPLLHCSAGPEQQTVIRHVAEWTPSAGVMENAAGLESGEGIFLRLGVQKSE